MKQVPSVKIVPQEHEIFCQRIPHIFWSGWNYNAPDGGFIQIIAIPLRNFKKTSILDPYIASKRLHKLYFLLDQATCHLTAHVRAAFLQRPIKHKYVSKRCTNWLQPADVAWMQVGIFQ